jgi:hypothetical protein
MYSLSIDSLHLPTKAETLKQWYPKALLENKIPNLKLQINLKFQYSMTKTSTTVVSHRCANSGVTVMMPLSSTVYSLLVWSATSSVESNIVYRSLGFVWAHPEVIWFHTSVAAGLTSGQSNRKRNSEKANPPEADCKYRIMNPPPADTCRSKVFCLF